MRAGIGYDVHPLIQGRRLVLGGVDIPFHLGLGGHSDGDVLTHAIMDALLGAAALPDIGTHFPPDDPRYKGASSLSLLREVRVLLLKKGFSITNVDVTVIAERPRVAPFVADMRRQLGQLLDISPQRIGIKATTNEGLGFLGRGEGIAAIAVALVEGPPGD
ncbi:MAG: 2-C-methyl-D-erythritol 2,4-cyclodiphosphate synthase [Chloroflexota bacterium]